MDEGRDSIPEREGILETENRGLEHKCMEELRDKLIKIG